MQKQCGNRKSVPSSYSCTMWIVLPLHCICSLPGCGCLCPSPVSLGLWLYLPTVCLLFKDYFHFRLHLLSFVEMTVFLDIIASSADIHYQMMQWISAGLWKYPMENCRLCIFATAVVELAFFSFLCVINVWMEACSTSNRTLFDLGNKIWSEVDGDMNMNILW